MTPFIWTVHSGQTHRGRLQGKKEEENKDWWLLSEYGVGLWGDEIKHLESKEVVSAQHCEYNKGTQLYTLNG